MAKSVDKMILEMVVENKKAIKNLNAVQKKGKQIGTESKGFLKSIRAGWIAAAAGVFLVVKSLGKLVNAYATQEKAERTLAAAMKQAGSFTEEAFKHNLKYASSLQKMTQFGDEAILGVQKMLTNFGIEGKALDDLTRATLDLAAAKGMDLKSAADLVAKSVGSSTNALTRYGISVTGAVGSTERAQTAVENITKLFGGAAAAEADTYSGKVQQMKNVFGDWMERLGAGVAGVLLPFVNTLKKVFTPADDIEDITQDLIKSQAEYTEVVIALKDAQGDLTTAERENLLVRKELLALDILAAIDEVNKKYKEQGEVIQNLTRTDNRNKDALESLRKKLISTKAATVELTEAEANLIGKSTVQAQGMGIVTDATFHRISALKNLSKAQRTAQESTVDRTEAEQKLSNTIALIATALQNKAITEEQLIGLDAQLLEQIRERVPLIEAEIEAEERKEESKIAKHEAELERIETEKKAKKDAGDKELKDRSKKNKLIIKEEGDLAKVKAFFASQEVEATRSALSTIAGLTSSGNKELFAIGKAASLSLAVINTAQAVTKALADVPFPLNLIVAPLIGIAGAVQVAKIAGTTFSAAAEGMDSAPGGPVLVGERGPEVVNLPKGAQVIPNHKINMARFGTIPAFANGGIVGGDTIENSGGNIIIEQLMLAPETPADFLDQLTEVSENLNVDILNP